MGKRLVGRDQYLQMLKMREDGYSYNQISIAMKIPVATVHYNVNNPPKTGYNLYASCGTTYGYSQHKKRKERACIPCCDANAADQQKHRNRPITIEAARIQAAILDTLDI